ncbi:2-hydroxy-6-oxo-6-phenylhexa-2,4-dienoate hydrolase [Lentzea aerocolonigenes]|uniref:2-hydroxy-6-oxo-6-phenylhexa-2,4-dienoate hydrolase n=1 Tax=Lentzea aerocolonigenes TaxID=68170 RepID=A0A0F0GMZ8_LENAE|nr:alpha/beta hydrolase [Lentzea aerocolonigenes]KJK44705.1 2-hydroxy-6-oxo-6-phenylhexa-2,4-dienoate hydrolase [Lentzea aerocolonigenes]
MHFVEHGAGTPVLAIHGWTPDHRLMLGCLEPFFATRPGYRRLYPDLPAMGKSPADGVESSDDVLAALEEFADKEIDGPFLLIGESYGGYLARALAHRRPEQVAGLALICPTGTAVHAADRTVPAFELRRSDGAELDPALAEQFDGMAVVRTAETARRFAEEIVPGLQVADLAAMARIQQRWELSDGPELGTYDRPALILTGRQDHVTGYEDVYPLLPHYPYATFAVLDTAGHNLQIEQPQLFNALLSEWLDRVAQ